MATKSQFTKKQIDLLESKSIFSVGLAHVHNHGHWQHHSWEDYKLIKLTKSKATFQLIEDKNEILTVNRQDLDDDFIRLK